MGYVYQLVCSINKCPVYVGSTKRTPSSRLDGHLSSIKKSEKPLYSYFRSIGSVPEMELLEEVADSDLTTAESNWINLRINEGVQLLNVKIIKNPKSGSIKVLPSVYKRMSDYCKANGVKITFFMTEALKEKLQKEKK